MVIVKLAKRQREAQEQQLQYDLKSVKQDSTESPFNMDFKKLLKNKNK